MAQEFNDQAESKFGVDELVDGMSQIAKLEIFIRQQVADGFSIVDALTIGLQAFPIAQEFIRDWIIFKQEAGDINKDELRAVEGGVRLRLTAEEANQSSVLALIDTIATGDEFARDTIVGAQTVLAKAKGIIR